MDLEELESACLAKCDDSADRCSVLDSGQCETRNARSFFFFLFVRHIE